MFIYVMILMLIYMFIDLILNQGEINQILERVFIMYKQVMNFI